jgi:hypothetical protein
MDVPQAHAYPCQMRDYKKKKIEIYLCDTTADSSLGKVCGMSLA